MFDLKRIFCVMSLCLTVGCGGRMPIHIPAEFPSSWDGNIAVVKARESQELSHFLDLLGCGTISTCELAPLQGMVVLNVDGVSVLYSTWKQEDLDKAVEQAGCNTVFLCAQGDYSVEILTKSNPR